MPKLVSLPLMISPKGKNNHKDGNRKYHGIYHSIPTNGTLRQFSVFHLTLHCNHSPIHADGQKLHFIFLYMEKPAHLWIIHHSRITLYPA